MARTSAATKGGTTAAIEATDSRTRLEAMAAIAARSAAHRPAREVLSLVRGVRTIFIQVDAITGIGAWPLDRVALVHGRSNEGKTEMCLGLGKSFLDAGHYFKLVDAEHTTPIDWAARMGIRIDHPGFSAIRPVTYEDAVDDVKRWAEEIGEAKVKGELPADTAGLAVVDSITKLTPKGLLAKLMKEVKEQADDEEADAKKSAGRSRKGKIGLDGMGGRAAQHKAALNHAWLNQLVPLMAHTGTSIAIITREIEDPDADTFSGKDYKLAGGRHLFFDSSLVVRVVLEGEVWSSKDADRKTYGQRHRVEIHKTKIGKKEERLPSALFHTSNGSFIPEGFDAPRDLLDIAKDMGLVEVRGSHYVFGRKQLGQGEHATVLKLHKDHELYIEIEAQARSVIEAKVARERARGFL